jgi:hypothetical protein
MRKFLKWLLIVVVILVLVIVAWLAYLGVFSVPQVTARKIGPYTLVYEDYTGPYSGTGQVISGVYEALKKEGVITFKGFGIYLDNPKDVAPDKLRSQLGCVLEDKDRGRAMELWKKFKVMDWPARDCLVAEFPIRSDLSYMIGPMKAYPELDKAFKAKGYKLGACLELYDLPAKKALYIFQIAK